MIKYNDRSNLADMLTPPYGTKLAYCVGTTFTIDLPALIQGALATQAISNYEEGEDLLPKGARNDVLYSKLEDFSSRSVIFCHANRISGVPEFLFDAKKASIRTRLLSLLDQVLISVNAPNKDMKKFGSFHPKVWFIRFDDLATKKGSSWRLIVASRNLTSVPENGEEKGSWEIGTCFNGTFSKKPSKMNQSIGEFLGYLSKKCNSVKHKNILKNALADLAHISFALPKGFDESEFLWSSSEENKFGILDNKKYEEALAVSPFLSKGCILELGKLSKYTLITGDKDLKYLNGTAVREHTLQFSMREHGLHTKLYICIKKNNSSDVFIGSANMTHSGLLGLNIEAMVKLSSRHNQLDRFKKDFVTPAKNDLSILQKLGANDISNLAESDEELNVVDKFRRHLEVGNFIIKRSKKGRGWALSWEGESLPDMPMIEATIKFQGMPTADLREVMKQQIVIREFSSAFFNIELCSAGIKSQSFSGIAIVENGACIARLANIHTGLVNEAASLAELLQAIVRSDGKNKVGVWNAIEPNSIIVKKTSKNHKVKRKYQSQSGVLEILLTADFDDVEYSKKIGKMIDIYVKEKKTDGKAVKDLWNQIVRIQKKIDNEAA